MGTASQSLFKLKEAVQLVDAGAFAESNRICAEVIAEDASNMSAAALLLETAFVCDLAQESVRRLIQMSRNNSANDEIAGQIKKLLQSTRITREYIPLLNKRIDGYDFNACFELSELLACRGEDASSASYHFIGTCLDGIISSQGEIDLRSQLNIPAKGRRPATDGSVSNVSFIAGCLSVRVAKFARALRAIGVKVKLYTRKNHAFAKSLAKEFDQVVLFTSEADLVQLLPDDGADIYHTFPNAEQGFIEVFTAMAIDSSKVILDLYDLSHPDVGPLKRFIKGSKNFKQFEIYTWFHKFLINHAAGICSRDLYGKILKSNLPGKWDEQKRIYLPELAWGITPRKKKLSAIDGELHVVHGGTFFNDRAYGSKWPFTHLFAEHAETLKIHFHLFGTPWGDPDMSEYEEISEVSPYFHLHDQLPYEEWLSELGKYDVGILQFLATDPELEGNVPRAVDPSGSWGNRFGDYLDGEAYLVCSQAHKALGFVAERYGIGRMGHADTVLTNKFWDEIKQTVLVDGVDYSYARKKLSIMSHAHRLHEFYETLVAAR